MNSLCSRVFLVVATGVSLVSCQTAQNADSAAVVEAARRVVTSHEQFVRSGDLRGVMSNVAEDMVVLAPNVPLTEGKAAVEALYRSFLASGRFELVHDYRGSRVAGDTVVFHGIARGTFTPPNGQPSSFANNFFLVLKKQPSGRYLLWRSAFAPAGGS